MAHLEGFTTQQQDSKRDRTELCPSFIGMPSLLAAPLRWVRRMNWASLVHLKQLAQVVVAEEMYTYILLMTVASPDRVYFLSFAE